MNLILFPSLFAGIAIELYQYKTKSGNVEFLDILYTSLSGIILHLIVFSLT